MSIASQSGRGDDELTEELLIARATSAGSVLEKKVIDRKK